MNIFLTTYYQCSICTTLLVLITCFCTLCLCGDGDLAVGGYTYIQVIQLGSCKVAIINYLIHTHTCWDWECQWQRYLEWAIQRYQCSYPCSLVRVVGQGQLNLLFVSQYWSDVHIVPLSGQCLLGVTSCPIKWNSLLTSIHAEAERNWLVGGQLNIELLNIVVNELLHLLYYPYWNSKC